MQQNTDLPHIIMFSYAKQTLQVGSREYVRMKRYSEKLGSLHMIVFTTAREGYQEQIVDGTLHLYATDTQTRLGSLLKAYQIGKSIVNKHRDISWVISSQDPFESSVPALLLIRVNNTQLHVQLHGDNFGNPYWRESRSFSQIRLRYGTYILRHAKKIRVVSHRIQRALIRIGVPESKITVLPIQPQLESFLGVGDRRIERQGDLCTFLYVGRFAPEKNLPMLLEAFARVHRDNRDLRLRLVGDGPLHSVLKQYIAEHALEEVVEIEPWSESISEEMDLADVFVLSSDHEAYGLVLIEAMAAGLPIVSTNVGCVGEVVMPDEHGYITEPKDTEAFSEALLRMAEIGSDRRYEMGQHNHEAAKRVVITQESYIARWVDSFTL